MNNKIFQYINLLFTFIVKINYFFYFIFFKFFKKFCIVLFLFVFFFPIKIILNIFFKLFYFFFQKINFIFFSFFYLDFLKKFFAFFFLIFYYFLFYKEFFLFLQEDFLLFQNNFSFYSFNGKLIDDFIFIEKFSLFSKTSPFVFFYNDFPNILESLDFPFKLKLQFDSSRESGISKIYYSNLLQHSYNWRINFDYLDYWTLRKKYLKGFLSFDSIIEILNSNIYLLNFFSKFFNFLIFLFDSIFFPFLTLVILKYKFIFILFYYTNSYIFNFFIFNLKINFFTINLLDVFLSINDKFLINVFLNFRLIFICFIKLIHDDIFGLILRYKLYFDDFFFTIDSYISSIFHNSNVFLSSKHLTHDKYIKTFYHGFNKDTFFLNTHKLFHNIYIFPIFTQFSINSFDAGSILSSINFFDRFLNMNVFHYYEKIKLPYFYISSKRNGLFFPQLDTQFFYFYRLPYKSFFFNDFFISKIFKYDFFSNEEYFYRNFSDYWFLINKDSKIPYTRKFNYMFKLFEYLVKYNQYPQKNYNFFYVTNNYFQNYSSYSRKLFDFFHYDINTSFYKKMPFYKKLLRFGTGQNIKKFYFWYSSNYSLIRFFSNIYNKFYFYLIYINFHYTVFIYLFIYFQVFFLFLYSLKYSFIRFKYDFYKINYYFYSYFYKNKSLNLNFFFYKILNIFFIFFFKIFRNFFFILEEILFYFFSYFQNFFSFKFFVKYFFYFCIKLKNKLFKYLYDLLFYFFKLFSIFYIRNIIYIFFFFCSYFFNLFFNIFFFLLIFIIFLFLFNIYINFYFFFLLKFSSLYNKPSLNNFNNFFFEQKNYNISGNYIFEKYDINFEDLYFNNFFLFGVILFVLFFFSSFFKNFKKDCFTSNYYDNYFNLEYSNHLNNSNPGEVFDFYNNNYISTFKEYDHSPFSIFFESKIPSLFNSISNLINRPLKLSENIIVPQTFDESFDFYKNYFWTSQSPLQNFIGKNAVVERDDISFLLQHQSPTLFLSENRVSSYNGIKIYDYSFFFKNFYLTYKSSFFLSIKYNHRILPNIFFIKKHIILKYFLNIFFNTFCENNIIKDKKIFNLLYNNNKLINFLTFNSNFNYIKLKKNSRIIFLFKKNSFFNKNLNSKKKIYILNNFFLFLKYKYKLDYSLIKYNLNRFSLKENIIKLNKKKIKKKLYNFKFLKTNDILEYKRFIFFSYEILSQDSILFKNKIRKVSKYLKTFIIRNSHRNPELYNFFSKLKIGIKNSPLFLNLFLMSKYKKGFLKLLRKSSYRKKYNILNNNFFDNTLLFYKSFYSFYDFEKYNQNFSILFNKNNLLNLYKKKNFFIYFNNHNIDLKKKYKNFYKYKKTLSSRKNSLLSNSSNSKHFLNIILRFNFEKNWISLKFFRLLIKKQSKINFSQIDIRNKFIMRSSWYSKDISTKWELYINRNFWNFNYLFDEDEENPFFFLNTDFNIFIENSGPTSWHNSFEVSFNLEFDFLNNYDSFEYSFDELDLSDVFFDPYEDEHPFSEKIFDQKFFLTTYSTFLNYKTFDKPYELFKFNASFVFSDKLLIKDSFWINDVIIDRFFINILGENLLLSSERQMLCNLAPFIKNSNFDVDFFKNRSNLIKNIYLNIFNNIPFFTMRKLNRFFWLRSAHMILINPFITGSEDFFLSSSQFINWHNHFFRKFNVSSISKNQNNFFSIKNNYEKFLTTNFSILFYTPYNFNFMFELKKVLGFYTLSLRNEDIFCNKFKRKFFKNIDYYINLLKLNNFPTLSKEEKERVFLYFGCNDSLWNSVDKNYKNLNFNYDLWDFPLIFFFLILICIYSKMDIFSFEIFFKIHQGRIYGVNSFFLDLNDILDVKKYVVPNNITLNNFQFNFNLNFFNFILFFEKVILPFLSFLSLIFFDFFNFFLFKFFFFYNYNEFYNKYSFFDILITYINNLSSNEFKFLLNFFLFSFYNNFSFKIYHSLSIDLIIYNHLSFSIFLFFDIFSFFVYSFFSKIFFFVNNFYIYYDFFFFKIVFLFFDIFFFLFYFFFFFLFIFFIKIF
jgi:hypothetical protein